MSALFDGMLSFSWEVIPIDLLTEGIHLSEEIFGRHPALFEGGAQEVLFLGDFKPLLLKLELLSGHFSQCQFNVSICLAQNRDQLFRLIGPRGESARSKHLRI